MYYSWTNSTALKHPEQKYDIVAGLILLQLLYAYKIFIFGLSVFDSCRVCLLIIPNDIHFDCLMFYLKKMEVFYVVENLKIGLVVLIHS